MCPLGEQTSTDEQPERIALGDGFCLTLSQDWIHAEPCAETPAQSWRSRETDGLTGAPSIDTCLTLTGAVVVLASCDTTLPGQHWTHTSAGRLRNLGSGQCLLPARTDRRAVPVTPGPCATTAG